MAHSQALFDRHAYLMIPRMTTLVVPEWSARRVAEVGRVMEMGKA